MSAPASRRQRSYNRCMSVRSAKGRGIVEWLVVLAAASGAVQVLVPYGPYSRVLRYLALSLFAYVVAVFLVPQDWGAVLRATAVPALRFDGAFVTALVAVIGTRLMSLRSCRA